MRIAPEPLAHAAVSPAPQDMMVKRGISRLRCCSIEVCCSHRSICLVNYL
jgi:hypothetical protein